MAELTKVGAALSITLNTYRTLVSLDDPFATAPAADAAEASRLAHALADDVLALSPRDLRLDDAEALSSRERLTAQLTVRHPAPYLSAEVHERLDRLLAYERLVRGATDVRGLPTVAEAFPDSGYAAARSTILWQGDITTLGVDAIVNAANDALLGCFHPFHACIDNAIHAAAGPRLREDCDRIMTRQGSPEPTGTAKVTRAYHLPARYVLHTVGPIYRGTDPVPPPPDQAALAASYRSCLDLAAEVGGIRSVAFCCISTGVFGFPARPAARIALDTVADWLDTHPGTIDRVVFNVFSAKDLNLYRQLLAVGETRSPAMTPRTTP